MATERERILQIMRDEVRLTADRRAFVAAYPVLELAEAFHRLADGVRELVALAKKDATT